MKSKNTAVIFMDFQIDVCDPEGKMLSKETDVIERFRKARGHATKLLAAARETNPSPAIVHVRHAFSPGYPELMDKHQSSMDKYVMESGAFVDGTRGSQIVGELQPRDDEHLVTKRTLSPFASTDLDWWLRKRGINSLVLAGVVTHYVVLSTAIAAHDMGYAVTVAKDCCTSGNVDTHETALGILGPIAAILNNEELLM